MGRALPLVTGALVGSLSALVLGTAAAAPVEARPPQQRPGAAVPVADSLALHRRARDAQARFERIRRRYLPTADAAAGGGPCDDRVGRMCWRHLPGTGWFPEPDDPRLIEAREELLAELAEVGRALPGDAWVLGQRVHYLGEAGRWDEAGELAVACGPPEPGWCQALRGLTLHVQGRYADAEAAFAAARADMAPGEAARWIDPRDLVDGDARRLLDEARERGDGTWEEEVHRLWRLADPLLLVEGNERLTEHFARHTALRIRSGARNPHALGWGPDMAELLLRYGWAVGWERTPRRLTDVIASEGVVGHEHPESRSHLPPGEVLRDPAAADAGAWTPGLAYARSTYAPAAAPVFLPLEVPVSLLPRGDRTVVVVPHRLPPDTTLAARLGERPAFDPLAAFARRPAEAGLFLVSATDDTVHGARATGDTEGGLLLDVPAGRYWISVEAWDPAAGRAGRMRAGLETTALPPDVAALSDLLLLRPGPEPTSLEEAVDRLRPDLRVVRGADLVVAWELTGLGWRPEVLDYTVSLVDGRDGLLRRAGRWLGLVDRSRPLLLAWSEEGPEAPGPAFRGVTLRIPGVEPGSWTLRVEVRTRGRSPLVSSRALQVIDASDIDVPGRHF